MDSKGILFSYKIDDILQKEEIQSDKQRIK